MTSDGQGCKPREWRAQKFSDADFGWIFRLSDLTRAEKMDALAKLLRTAEQTALTLQAQIFPAVPVNPLPPVATSSLPPGHGNPFAPPSSLVDESDRDGSDNTAVCMRRNSRFAQS